MVQGLFVAVASLAEHRLQALGLRQLQHLGSGVAAHGPWSMQLAVAVVHGLRRSVARGIFLDQG